MRPVAHLNELGQKLSRAQKNGELCDFELACNGQTVAVHKLIVCMQSPVIKAACAGSFQEASGRYEIKDCSFETVQQLVDYLYTGNYEIKHSEASEQAAEQDVDQAPRQPWWAHSSEPPPGRQRDVFSELVLHIRMFGLADKYLIDGLLELSKTKIKKTFRAERNTCNLFQSVAEIYDLQFESGKLLRDVVIETVRERIAVTPLKDSVQQSLEDLMDEIPEFAVDLAKSYLKRPTLGHCSNCGGSSKIVSIAPIQCRCAECGKGGASPLGTWYEG
ncbi:BTB/POZ protein [Trichoderma barbatum]